MPRSAKYGSPKVHRPSIRLTEEGLNLLKEKAKAAGVSLSEYLEQIARTQEGSGELQA